MLQPASDIRPMTMHDLETVLRWRNHPHVRRFMLSQHEISDEEHSRWFARAENDPQRHLLIYSAQAIPVGFVNAHINAANGDCEWGFYRAPEALPGTGRMLGTAALKYLFEKAAVKKVVGQVLDFNSASIRLHLRLNFEHESTLVNNHFDGNTHHDVLCFGLSAKAWRESV